MQHFGIQSPEFKLGEWDVERPKKSSKARKNAEAVTRLNYSFLRAVIQVTERKGTHTFY